jgi:hypothetical protein
MSASAIQSIADEVTLLHDLNNEDIALQLEPIKMINDIDCDNRVHILYCHNRC